MRKAGLCATSKTKSLFDTKPQEIDRQLVVFMGGIRLRQKPQAPTPEAPVRNRSNRQTKVANAKVRVG